MESPKRQGGAGGGGDDSRKVMQLVVVFLGVILLMNNLYGLESRFAQLEQNELELYVLAKDALDRTISNAKTVASSTTKCSQQQQQSGEGGEGNENGNERPVAAFGSPARGGAEDAGSPIRSYRDAAAPFRRPLVQRKARATTQPGGEEEPQDGDRDAIKLLGELIQNAKGGGTGGTALREDEQEVAEEDRERQMFFELTPQPQPPGNVYETLPPSTRQWGRGDPNYRWTQSDDKPLVGVLTINAQVGKGGRGLAGKSGWMYPMSYHNKQQYCKKWNYDLIIEDNQIVDRTRDVAWSKIPALKKWLPNYQWLMWMDMDAFFMRFDYDIEHLLNEDVDFIIGKDWHGVNMGVFFIRNSPYAYQLLETLWNTPKDKWYPWEEQSALMHLLKSTHTTAAMIHVPHMLFPPLRDLNAYPSDFAFNHKPSKYVKGDFIAHFPNCKSIKNCRRIMEGMFNTMATENMLPPIPEEIPSHHYPQERQPRGGNGGGGNGAERKRDARREFER